MTAPETRRFPITLRELQVVEIEDLNPRMRRITLAGPQLAPFEAEGRSFPRFESPGPDDHVKLFFPDPETGMLSLPRQGEGRLHWPQDPPAISREYTPRGFDPCAGRLVLDFVLHGHGVAGTWAAKAVLGQRIHLGGPRASMLLPDAARYLLIGDETALPAIANWLEMLPETAQVAAHVLIGAPEAKIPLVRPAEWHGYDDADADAMAALIRDAGVTPDTYVWAAGERAAIAALRAHLNGLGHSADLTDLSNYWTRGTAAEN